jgi:hypothetical protein
MKQIKVHNPWNLPVRPYQELYDFQDDFKHEIEPEALKKLKNSLIRHGVFVPKFVWLDGEKACIIDGHQTRKALESLEAEGYTIPPIPYVEIQAESRANAAEKLLQINSRYAKINPESDFLRDLENAKELLERIEIPEIRLDLMEIPFIDGDGEDLPDETYTSKIVSPIYEPKGERPPLSALIDRGKTEELIAGIDAAELPPAVAAFLKYAAERHTVFNFRQIAEYYCHADETIQELMEQSGMVIIDFKKAIEYGFVHLTERLGAIADIEEGENDA